MTENEVSELCKDAAPDDPCEGEIVQFHSASGPGRSTDRCEKHQKRYAAEQHPTLGVAFLSDREEEDGS